MTRTSSVSKIFAFVCDNAEFTNSIVFADSEVPEIRPEERSAIASVERHLRDSYVSLLSACRDAFYERAGTELQKTMGKNWNRDDSIWERGRVELPMLIESSYVEVASHVDWSRAKQARTLEPRERSLGADSAT